jgi:hypothetical protein
MKQTIVTISLETIQEDFTRVTLQRMLRKVQLDSIQLGYKYCAVFS